MNLLSGFEPVINDNCSVLILGSMPGVASLKKQQYYAYPRNVFWPIIDKIFDIDLSGTYKEKCFLLNACGVAVWDVLEACKRTGSLDADIESTSEKANDFLSLFTEYESIRAVFFNGSAAERLYKKHVLNSVNNKHTEIVYHRLPSTSPAYAAMRVEEKLKHWQKITEYL